MSTTPTCLSLSDVLLRPRSVYTRVQKKGGKCTIDWYPFKDPERLGDKGEYTLPLWVDHPDNSPDLLSFEGRRPECKTSTERLEKGVQDLTHGGICSKCLRL